MGLAVKEIMIPTKRCSIVCTGDAEFARRLNHAAGRFARPAGIQLVSSYADLRIRMAELSPRVLVLEDRLVEDNVLADVLRLLTETAPVILAAAPGREEEMSGLIAEGDVDFVARTGDFIPLVAGLMERRLRWAERSDTALGPPWGGAPPEAAEIFRHEFNNPLTGILGNAELVLAHRDRLSPGDTQRLQTVVELAVRLRETIRRLTQAWERESHSLKSA
jgi:signal transduction histidine kinase